MRLAAFDFSPRCSYFHTVSLCLPPRCSPPLMCCRRAASRPALASVGCRRRLRSLAALHSRSELKHQKSAFRRSENCGRPRSRFNKDRTRLSTSCYSLRNRRSYRMRQFGLGERSRVRVGARVGSAMGGTPSLPILAFPSTLRSFMATRLRKCVPRRKGPVAILVRLWAQFSPFTAVSEPSNKVAKTADSRKCPSDR